MLGAETLTAARGYVALGFRVLPLYPADPATGACACPAGEACALAGAHPLDGLSTRDASRDIARVEQWWADAPDANVGIALGAQRGVLVVRVDTSVPATAQLLTELTETGAPVASTPSGLVEAYFAASAGDAIYGARLTGVEVLADDAVVVAPPSVVPGGQVEWVAPIADCAGLPNLPWTVGDLAGVVRELVGGHATARPANWSPPRAGLDRARPALHGDLEPVLIKMRDVAPSVVKWILQGRFPSGTIIDLTAHPGVGKSTLGSELAALITRGAAFPPTGERVPQGSVLILCREEDPGRTLRPRLEAAGADLDRVHLLTDVRFGGVAHALRLPEHLAALERACAQNDVKLVIIDTGSDFSAGFDTYHDVEIRDLLLPLTELARRYEFAVLFIRHLAKRPPAFALHGGLGGVAYGAVARAGFTIRVTDGDERILDCTKASLGPRPPSLKFRIVGAAGPEGSSIGRIEWLGELEANVTDVDEPTKAELAERFLVEVLSEGEVAKTRLEELAEAAGIGWRTVEKAKAALGVESFWVRRVSMWRLPGTGNDDGGKS